MRPVTLNATDPQAALREIERASHENDVGEIAQNFSFSGTVVQTTTLIVTSSATAANCAQVLATLLQILQKGGLHRTT